MTKPNVELNESEWPIIKAVWEAEPCTAPAIQEKLLKTTGWTYSTVRTLMDRMAAKGLLHSRKEGKLTFYTSGITREQAQQRELRYALKHAFNGAMAPMLQCLLETQDLTPAELNELKQLIARQAPDPTGGKGRL